MSLFIQLYEKIAPISKDETSARALADVLVDAIEGKHSDLVTKKDLTLAVSSIETKMLQYIVWGVGFLAALQTVLKFVK